MTRALATRARLPVLLAMLALLPAGGCIPDEPEPTPEPAPRYLPVPRDLCTRISMKEIAGRFDLEVPPWYEPSTDYSQTSAWWGMACSSAMVGGSERFTTVYGGLDPHGSLRATVYRDSERAPQQYRNSSGSFTRPRPNSPVAVIEGWWDEGLSVETVQPIPQGSLRRDPDASSLQIDYFIYHENLYLHAYLVGTSVTSEVDDALPILYDVMEALIEETKTQLTLVETG